MADDANSKQFQRIRAKLFARAAVDETFQSKLAAHTKGKSETSQTESITEETLFLRRPAFKPHFRLEFVKNEGVFLLSEQGHFVLTGRLNELVAPLIDGQRSSDEIADLLFDQLKMEETYYALALLEKDGYLIEAYNEINSAESAFWSALNLNANVVGMQLAEARIAIESVGQGTAVPLLRQALHELGFPLPSNDNDAARALLIVLTDDYLQPAIAEINKKQIAAGLPWMLVKAGGLLFWLGPLFIPGQTACWQCLAQRLHSNRFVESFLKKKGVTGPFPVAHTRTSASIRQAVYKTAMQAALFIASGENSHLQNQIITTNVVSDLSEQHTLQRRPQCPACGNLEQQLQKETVTAIQKTTKTISQDGGYRSVTPEQTFTRYQQHISPITGIMTSLRPAPNLNNGLLHVYIAGHNLALKDDSLYFLRQGLRSKSMGKGSTDTQAKTSALCEAIERYSGVYRGEEKTIQATYRELGDAAIHPNSCMLFSEQQYWQRQQWLDQGSLFQRVPLPFREDVTVDWTPVYSLSHDVTKYLPSGYLYYNYPLPDDAFFFWADSNGNAAGNTLAEPILQGFLELYCARS